MKIVGNSRAKVETIDVDGTLLVRKTCVGHDAIRLEAQIRKQIECNVTPGIRTPHVHFITSVENTCEATMEFVSGLDFVSFTSQADIELFKSALNKIIKFVRHEFDSATLQQFPEEKWKQKSETVLKHATSIGLQRDFIESVSFCLTGTLPKEILIGDCHGDLTFSNAIVERNGDVCVFDFLDPPVETPYEDVSKLMQDAEFFWSLGKYTGACDKTRVMVMWSHAKKMILKSLADVLDQNTLRMFQVMTLMRIIPYTTNEKIIQYITGCISRKLNETDTSMWR